MTFFPQAKLVTQIISWIIILGLVGGLIYALIMNVIALQYSPDNVVKRFTALIENPTQTVTDEEKKELQDITQSSFFSNWGNENNLKTLRRISQQHAVTNTGINYTGESRKYATVDLTFSNNLKNPNSKKGKLYLERYGQWYSGLRWRIYQIDTPEEDNLINTAQNNAGQAGQQTQDTIKSLQDKLKELLGQ